MSGYQIRCETSLPGDGTRPPDEIPGFNRRRILPTAPIAPVITPNSTPKPPVIQPTQPSPTPSSEPLEQLTRQKKK